MMKSIHRLAAYPRSVLFQILLEKITFQTVQIRKFQLLEYAGVPNILKVRGPGSIRWGAPSDIPQMQKLESPVKREIFRARFAAGEHCAVAVHGREIIGYEWYSAKPCHCEERYLFKIDVPEDALYAYDALIRPDYRISGVWIRFKMFLAAHMKMNDKARIITLIDNDNRMSMNTHLRFGFKVYRSVVFIKVAGTKYFLEKNLAKPDRALR